MEDWEIHLRENFNESLEILIQDLKEYNICVKNNNETNTEIISCTNSNE